MKEVSIREARQILGKLDRILEKEGEIKLTKRGKPIAVITPVNSKKCMPSHKKLRESMRYMDRSSESMIREERDSR